ncbi:hypothetical protein Bca52824_024929 [Brassica carinata]|uniref:Uncharacterized protein n=1 Tax=Brassica carinata TaxID=52824 RepID=A0A8X8AW74_BRACI|nr:hypothetical protein Bca52824_024929 [Brassica carinata]
MLLCPKLEVLWIKSCPNVTDASMAKIATNCPNLREIDVSYSYCISHEALFMLGRHCQNLEILKRNLLPRQGPNLPTVVVPVDYILAFPRYGNIESRIIGRHMPRLKHLELRYSTMTVRGLTWLCGGCSNLEHLDLCGCVSLSNSDITRCTSNLKNLMQINKPDFNRSVGVMRLL